MALPDFKVTVVDENASPRPDYRVAVVAADASPRPDFAMEIQAEGVLPDFRVAVVDESDAPDFRVSGDLGGLPAPEPEPIDIAAAGSSTEEYYGTQFTGPVNENVFRTTDGLTFAAQGDVGAFDTRFGDAVNTATGRPVRKFAFAKGGTRVSQWMGAGSADRAALVAACTQPGVNLTALRWAGGYNDAAAETVTSAAAHEANLTTLFNQFRSELGKPDLPIFITMTQRARDTATATTRAQLAMVRSAELAMATKPNTYLLSNTLDVERQADTLHQSEAGQITSASRAIPVFLAVLGGQAPLNGPRAIGAVAVSDTETDILFEHDGGTDITPSTGITGASVALTSSGSALAISSVVRQTSSSIRVTHASKAGAAVTVSYLGTGVPDVAGIVRDNSALTLPSYPSQGVYLLDGTVPSVAEDTFSTNGALLGAQADTGETWGSYIGGFQKASGSAYNTNGSSTFYLNFVPSTTSYFVEDEWEYTSALGINDYLAARITAANSYLYAGWNSATLAWNIGQNDAGTVTVLDTVPATPVVGQVYHRRLVVGPGLVELWIDGIMVCSSTASTLTQKGLGGMRTSGVAATSSTGSRRRLFRVGNL